MTPWKPFYYNPNHRRLVGIIILPSHLVQRNRSQLFLSEKMTFFNRVCCLSHSHNHFHIWDILSWKCPQSAQPGLGGEKIEGLHLILSLGWSFSPVEISLHWRKSPVDLGTVWAFWNFWWIWGVGLGLLFCAFSLTFPASEKKNLYSSAGASCQGTLLSLRPALWKTQNPAWRGQPRARANDTYSVRLNFAAVIVMVTVI